MTPCPSLGDQEEVSPGTRSVEGVTAGKSRIRQHPESGAALPCPEGLCTSSTSSSGGSGLLGAREGHWGMVDGAKGLLQSGWKARNCSRDHGMGSWCDEGLWCDGSWWDRDRGGCLRWALRRFMSCANSVSF